MILEPLAVAGAWEIGFPVHRDRRGSFVRAWCAETLAAIGVDREVAQCSLSASVRRGTLRGIHWQAEPHRESKLVRCVAGRVWDVVVDLRPDSPTFGTWASVELDAARANAVYVPPLCGHAFVTLTPDAVLHYQMDTQWEPAAARSIRFDDPDLAIEWPIPVSVISDRDRLAPSFAEAFGDAPTVRLAA